MTLTKSLLCLTIFPFVSAALGVPPTNVTVTCRNLQNIVNWDYDHDVPGLRFRVKVRSDSSLQGCPTEFWVDQPRRQANVSFLPNPDSATYLIEVNAVLGKNESDPAKIKFSYFHNSEEGQKCLLDLPPVNITSMPDHVQWQFEHPWLLYKAGASGCKKSQKKKRNNEEEDELPLFTYSVNIVGQDKHHTLECDEAVCANKLQVDAAQDEHCLKIKGTLQKMTVESPREYCTHKPPQPFNPIGLIVGIVVSSIVAVALVACMVCWKKTRPILHIPHTLIFGESKKQAVFKPLSDQPSPVEAVTLPINPKKEDEEIISPAAPSSREYEGRMKLSPFNQNLSEDVEEEKATCDEDPYEGGQKLEEEQESEEEGHSPYERRSVMLTLAPEDRAEGYRA